MKIGITYLLIFLFLSGFIAGCSNNNQELLNATREGNFPKVQTLIEHEGFEEITDKNGLTLLMIASLHGHVAITNYLIKKGAKINHQDKHGFTALHLAAQEGHLSIIKILLENGAAIDIVDDTGWPALLVAIQYGHLDIVREIISKDKNVNFQYSGVTPLYIAVQNNELSIVQLLLEKGADPLVPTKIGETPIDLAKDRNYSDIYFALMQKTKSFR